MKHSTRSSWSFPMHLGWFFLKKINGAHRAMSINPDPLRPQKKGSKQWSYTVPRGQPASLTITPSQGSPHLCAPDTSCLGENGLGVCVPKATRTLRCRKPNSLLGDREEPKGSDRFASILHLRSAPHWEDGWGAERKVDIIPLELHLCKTVQRPELHEMPLHKLPLLWDSIGISRLHFLISLKIPTYGQIIPSVNWTGWELPALTGCQTPRGSFESTACNIGLRTSNFQRCLVWEAPPSTGEAARTCWRLPGLMPLPTPLSTSEPTSYLLENTLRPITQEPELW